VSFRRSTRTSQSSTRLRDFVTYKVTHPIEKFISYENITREYKTYLTSIENKNEPNFFEEAIDQPIWCKAMREELNAVERNETWELVPLPIGKKPWDANGYIKLNTIAMVPLNGIKQG
jgi:hypothetical protein